MSKQGVNIHENTIGEVGRLHIERGGVIIAIYTLKEYATIHDCSVETVRRMIDSGKLIGIKVDNLWFVQPISFSSVDFPLDTYG